jgi:hypothetical protein
MGNSNAVEFMCAGGRFFLALADPSQTTFCRIMCKIVAAFDVNSFAKLYFIFS